MGLRHGDDAVKCCDLTSGKLRTPVVFERETRTPDGAGGSTITWSTQYATRAYVKPVSGTERYRAGRLEAAQQVRIFIRYTDKIKTSDRVTYKGEALQVRAIINLEERDRWLEVYAESGVVT